MATRIPPNWPRSMTGPEIVDWIYEGKKFGINFPADYTVNGAPATDIIDFSLVYTLEAIPLVPTKGYIHQNVTGELVEAVELTPEVAGRLSAGGAISGEMIDALLDDWFAHTIPPRQKMYIDIQTLIAEGKVDY